MTVERTDEAVTSDTEAWEARFRTIDHELFKTNTKEVVPRSLVSFMFLSQSACVTVIADVNCRFGKIAERWDLSNSR